jgi:hypothetical protein
LIFCCWLIWLISAKLKFKTCAIAIPCVANVIDVMINLMVGRNITT